MGDFYIYDFKVECQDRPLGIDCKIPRFSWKMNSDQTGARQLAYDLTVKKAIHPSLEQENRKKDEQEEEEIIWDTGKVASSQSNEIFYQGKDLLPCTRYTAKVTVWDEREEKASLETWFETGLLNPSIHAWEGAKFIGPSRYAMCAAVRGIFALETTFKIKEGSYKGGVVFGEQDERLLDSRMNDYGIEGKNYIRYELNVENDPAQIYIFRVGYAKDDSEEQPFALFPAVDYESKEMLITKQNRYDAHFLRIEVTGDCAYTYLDGHLVDAIEKEIMGYQTREPRQLNPRANNDCITYPRLNRIGFYAGPGDTVLFKNIVVKNLRTPCATVVNETPEEGLYKEETIFKDALLDGTIRNENGWFCLSAGQVTARPRAVSIPMLRTTFAVQKGKKLQSARLYATARGIYECRINGQNPAEGVYFSPGCSQYDHHLLYQTYDVTNLVREGGNAIGATLASGWWSDSQTYVLRNYNYYGDRESFLAKLVLQYEDGERQVIVTDPQTWRYYAHGPYQYAGFFLGERLDGTNYFLYEEYSLPEFVEEGWEKPEEIIPVPIKGFDDVPAKAFANWPDLNQQDPEIIGEYEAPVREYCRVTAKSMSMPRKGLYVYDLGQEIAGIPQITLKEKKGTVVTFRYGEILYPNLPEYGDMKGMVLYENLRDATSTDIYCCRGDEDGEIYKSKFTFHGFRYIEVSGTSTPLPLDAVVGIQLSSIQKMTGQFDCSNALLNRFVENVKWSQLCNFISIPTDCPQRNERMGWAGDTHVFTGTALRNSDLRLFYYRVLEAFCDLQKNGKFPEIAPAGGGFGGITYESAPIYITWELYLAYGDKKIVQKVYPHLDQFMEYLIRAGMPGSSFVGPLADWLSLDETDSSLLWNAFYGRDCLLMKKMAVVLGDLVKEMQYEKRYREAVQYWNDTFVDAKTGKTVTVEEKLVDTQCSYALPLCYGMVKEEQKANFGDHLTRTVKENGYCITTGFFGTGLINEALTKTGHTDVAYRLMLQTKYPSWLYPVTQGATTIWERWNSYTVEKGFGGNNAMNSFNHYSLGSVVSWLYQQVLGIQEDEEHPGYSHFFLAPHAMELDEARGKMDTSYGVIESSWKRESSSEGERIVYRFRIPANTTATVKLDEQNLPLDRTLICLKEGELSSEVYIASSNESTFVGRGITPVKNGIWEFELGAGRYCFSSQAK